jgi:P4 family phage/plasmid primase-like protien
MTEPEVYISAKSYHDQGISVIPFKITQKPNGEYDKQNLAAWKKWETEPQTQDEFNALNWKEANAFGILLGTRAKNGYYLTVVDYDVKGKITEQAKAIGKEILSELPITRVEETVNKGLHYLYWNRFKLETDGTFHDSASVELLGSKKLCLMAPSFGYKNVGSDIITSLENLEDWFYNALKKHGCIHNEEIEVENQVDSYGFQLSKIIDLSSFTKLNANEYQGKHPTHDSTTEKNFCVNVKDNTWHCFRHNSGGGALQFLAVKEGLIKCEHAKKGALRGRKFREILAIAANQGLIDQKTLEQNEINPVILAKDVMEDYHFVTDQDTNELYYWIENKGIYSKQTEQLIKREIVKRLDENFKSRYYTEINDFITNSAPLIKINSQNPEMLAVKNGLLNVFTEQLTAFSHEIYITSKLDWEYLENVKAQNFLKFIDDVLPNKTQQKQLQQLVGHCLYRKIITETCLILIGKGENGKSIFLTVIKEFLGSNNVSSHSIQQICYDKFVIDQIKDKLANICADLPHKELMNTGTYKALVSGDSVEIYIKHVQGCKTIDPYTKYLYSANHIPTITTEEDSNAWYRRFIFADFNQTFKGKAKIPRQTLLDMLTTPEEMTGILNWALEGLKELKKNGEITDKPSVEEIRKEYRKRSSTTLAYFDSQVQITDNEADWVFTDDWFRDYVTFCHENNLKPKSKFQFLQDIEENLSGAYRTKIRPEPKQSPLSAWRYVKIVPRVPCVPQFSNLSAKIEKKQLENFSNNNDLSKKCGTGGTDGTINPEVYKDRFCSVECVNFHKPECPLFFNRIGEDNRLPSKCYGFKAPNPGEETS